MPIKAVTYYEAWCEVGPERIELGDYTAMADEGHVIDMVNDYDGVVCADGRVYCEQHVPDDVCRGTDDNVHKLDEDGTCTECPWEPKVEEPPPLVVRELSLDSTPPLNPHTGIVSVDGVLTEFGKGLEETNG